MSKKLFLVIILICSTIVVSLTGCGGNEITLYLGTSETPENNTKLELNTAVTIEQSKEKIENSKLVFYKNNDKSFDNINLCFSGNNIKSVVASSKNKTILYDHYDTVTRCVDDFEFYYPIDISKIDETFKPEVDFEYKWDNGDFDKIRNVYFDGMTYMDIIRSRHDPSKEIASVVADISSDVEPDFEYYYINDPVDNKFYYLDQKAEEIKKPVIYVNILKNASNDKKLTDDPDDEIILGESVETNKNVEQDSFIYRYEKLFYNSQQTALKDKGSFDYSDLTGETVEITVNYTNDSAKNYKLEVSFDKSGNIIATLR